MPVSYQMSWVASTRRWKKMAPRQALCGLLSPELGVPETKEASWCAANDWWERQQDSADLPTADDRVARAVHVNRLVQDFGKLDEESRKQAWKPCSVPGPTTT